MATWIVERASIANYSNKGVPCDEAVQTGGKQVARDTFVPVYSVTLNTLEELQAFIEKYGEVIISADKIVIYDDYVE